MAPKDLVIGGMLNNILFGGEDGYSRSDGPMGRPTPRPDDTSVFNIQKAPNGLARVTFNTPDPSPMAAVARENFRRLGMDSPFVGRKAVTLDGKYNGDTLNFEIGGKEVSLNAQALQNARGTQLANLLGMGSFMEFNRAKTAATERMLQPGLTDRQPELAPQKSNVPLPPERPAEFAATPQNGKIETQQPMQQPTIPQMLASPPQMLPLMAGPIPAAGQPLPGMQPMPGYLGMLQQIMPQVPANGQAQTSQAGKASKKGLPSIGSDYNALGPFGGAPYATR